MSMDTLRQDLGHTVRHLVRSPVFTIGAVAILAVGIGANTTVFTVVDALLFRAPPWSDPDQVVHVYQDSDDGEPSSSSFPATRDMAGSDVFAAVAATTPSSAAWDGPEGPENVATEYTTSSFMKVLGLSVQRGRWFGPEDDVPGTAPVAVVTAAAWHARFGSDPDIIGRSISLNGQPVTIIGVGPEKLTGTFTPLLTDFWLSISATLVSGTYQVQNLELRSDHWYEVRARLADGVTVQQARAAMDALAGRLAEEYPEYNKGRGITVFSSRDVRIHPSGDGALVLAGGLLSALVLTVLLLACANLANLLLVRGLSRAGEMAVRSALGAPRGRVARLFLMESLLLSVMGGAVGLLFTRWALAAIPALPLGDVLGGTLELGVDARVASFSVGLMVFTGVLFGLAPALRSARADVAQTLRDDRRGATGGRGSTRLRSLLVAVQVAASLVLVLGTGLIARSLAALQTVDTGLDADRIAFVRTDWSRSGIEGGDAVRVALDEMRRRAQAIPGVTGAAVVSRLPAQNAGSTSTEVEGYTPPAGTEAVELPFAVVGDGYFETMGIPLVTGRLFGDDDVPDTGTSSILINETAANRFYGEANPIGRRMRAQASEPWTRTVVGVVGDVPVGRLGEAPRPMFYFSTRQVTRIPAYLMVRTEGDPAALAPALRQVVADMSASVSVSAQGTLAGHFGATLATPRLAARAMGVFSVLALLLAGLGIYAVVSFSVARRTSELGIRMALGAGRAGVVRMVVREVVGVVVAGLALGLGVAVLVATRIGGLLYGVDALDPITFGGAVVTLTFVAWVAAYVPARRAAKADPVEAFRAS
jgi:predicted permease